MTGKEEKKVEVVKSAEIVVDLPLDIVKFYRLGFSVQTKEGVRTLVRNGLVLLELPEEMKGETSILQIAQGWLENLVYRLTTEQWEGDWKPYLEKMRLVK